MDVVTIGESIVLFGPREDGLIRYYTANEQEDVSGYPNNHVVDPVRAGDGFAAFKRKVQAFKNL